MNCVGESMYSCVSNYLHCIVIASITLLFKPEQNSMELVISIDQPFLFERMQLVGSDDIGRSDPGILGFENRFGDRIEDLSSEHSGPKG